jgi:hypothetical protein
MPDVTLFKGFSRPPPLPPPPPPPPFLLLPPPTPPPPPPLLLEVLLTSDIDMDDVENFLSRHPQLRIKANKAQRLIRKENRVWLKRQQRRYLKSKAQYDKNRQNWKRKMAGSMQHGDCIMEKYKEYFEAYEAASKLSDEASTSTLRQLKSQIVDLIQQFLDFTDDNSLGERTL